MTSIRCEETTTGIPTYLVGPLSIKGEYAHGEFMVPLATTEKPLIAGVNRGCKLSRACGGIETVILKDEMTRAPVFRVKNLETAQQVIAYVYNLDELARAAESTTRYGHLTSIEPKLIGDNLFLRIGMDCGDAAGHNMTTKASLALTEHLEKTFPGLSLVSLSGNYCVDKKSSAINHVLGRGKSMIAQLRVPSELCKKILKTMSEKIYDLNIRKNYIGSVASGSLGANTHYANMLAAIYLATGQDIANIIEGSQGITTASLEEGNLVFSVNLPSVIVGTVGGGTKNKDQRKNLELLECAGTGYPLGSNAKKLAEIIAATVLAGEINGLAVQSNHSELVSSHEGFR